MAQAHNEDAFVQFGLETGKERLIRNVCERFTEAGGVTSGNFKSIFSLALAAEEQLRIADVGAAGVAAAVAAALAQAAGAGAGDGAGAGAGANAGAAVAVSTYPVIDLHAGAFGPKGARQAIVRGILTESYGTTLGRNLPTDVARVQLGKKLDLAPANANALLFRGGSAMQNGQGKISKNDFHICD